MRASLAVCILAALLATGACLKCEVCDGPGTSCTGDLQTCAAGEDICGIARTEVTWAGMKTQTILKGCVTSSQCRSSPVSVNFGNGMEIMMRFTCCMGDACRTSTVTVPPADPKPNGRRCRGCYVLNAAQCKEQATECAGSETQCLDAAGTDGVRELGADGQKPKMQRQSSDYNQLEASAAVKVIRQRMGTPGLAESRLHCRALAVLHARVPPFRSALNGAAGQELDPRILPLIYMAPGTEPRSPDALSLV
ncbi:phospholipase A2 inhibitor NAI-like [Eretmochelys imbricata]